MNAYFITAISQLKQYLHHCEIIVKTLEKSGHKVKKDHVFNQALGKILSASDEEKTEYYKKFLSWINESDIVVAEASFPSTVHVGYEISMAIEKGKPVVVFYIKGKEPVFLKGIKSDKLVLVEYDENNLPEKVKESVNQASSQQDTRFNFFISPAIVNYLDWIAKKKRIPRAVYLRRLIEKDMKKSKGEE